MCSLETTRLFPVLGHLTKLCTEDFELTDYKDHKLTVRKGTAIYIPTYSIHHDEEHYSNPEQFDPDRFSAENGGLKKFKDKGVYLAFSDGPRICLGMRYGTLQVKVAIVELIRNFIFKPNAKTQVPCVYDPSNFMLAQVGGLWVDFIPMNSKNM